MSGTEKSATNDDVQAPGDMQALMDELTLNRDVKEVFLLIDHISGRSEKSLKDLETTGIELPFSIGEPVPPPASDRASVSDVLHRLCQIGYPPHPDSTTKAHKAAFVLLLKDRLNALASPALGITIAYTTMFVSMTNGCSMRQRARYRLTDPRHSIRGDLARDAYPLLEPHARCFASFFRVLPWLMAAVLVLTASAYWDVGFGRTIVQRIEQIDKQRSELWHPDRQSGAVPVPTRAACEADSGLTDDLRRLCIRLRVLNNQLDDSRKDLSNFALAASGQQPTSWFWWTLGWFRPVHYGFSFMGQSPTGERPEASVAWILSLFSTYVLPAMFGFLGTLSAMMRAIQAKVRDSVLGPRDLPLSVLGLFIGPMAGLAVGLFYTPTGDTTTNASGLAGTVSLSAAGLGFLAGYGADAFFKFLDALLTRVFALDKSNK